MTPRELEPKTADNWLARGTITITELGEENTYYVDEFDTAFYCKNYPDHAQCLYPDCMDWAVDQDIPTFCGPHLTEAKAHWAADRAMSGS